MTLRRLNQHLNIVWKLQEATGILGSLQAIKAPNHDGMPHSHSVSRNTENIALAIERQIGIVNRLEQAAQMSEREIREFIDSISDPRTQIIFDLRFLCGMKWEAVASMIGGGNTASTVSMACYRYMKSGGTE